MSGVSVIIPVYREDPMRLRRCLLELEQRGPAHEVIVAGCGEDRALRAAAEESKARYLAAPRGRAYQMNRGAAEARGRILLFLHADTLLPHRWPAEVERVLDGGAVLGAFRFALDPDNARNRIVEAGVALRMFLLRLPYGDQAIFLRRDTFRNLGGYDQSWNIMEDLDLVLRAGHLGRVVVSDLPARTSARRWEAAGYLRTTARNYLLAGALAFGWKPGPEPDAWQRWVARSFG